MLFFLRMSDKNKNFSTGRDDTLKIIGIIAMAVDHIGLALYPNIPFLRIIGRLAFPIFAWYLAEGFIYTSSFKKYASRLFFFALISQIPAMLVAKTYNLNILFSLLLGLFALQAYKNKRYLTLGALVLLSAIIPVDYSFYGLLTILFFYIFKERKTAFLVQSVLNIAGVFLLSPIQAFSLTGAALALYYPKNLPKLRLNKYFFYIFYPVHLLVIYGLSLLPAFSK